MHVIMVYSGIMRHLVMALVHPTRITWRVQAKDPIIVCFIRFNISHHPKSRTGDVNPSLYGQFQCPGMYVQSIS